MFYYLIGFISYMLPFSAIRYLTLSRIIPSSILDTALSNYELHRNDFPVYLPVAAYGFHQQLTRFHPLRMRLVGYYRQLRSAE